MKLKVYLILVLLAVSGFSFFLFKKPMIVYYYVHAMLNNDKAESRIEAIYLLTRIGDPCISQVKNSIPFLRKESRPLALCVIDAVGYQKEGFFERFLEDQDPIMQERAAIILAFRGNPIGRETLKRGVERIKGRSSSYGDRDLICASVALGLTAEVVQKLVVKVREGDEANYWLLLFLIKENTDVERMDELGKYYQINADASQRESIIKEAIRLSETKPYEQWRARRIDFHNEVQTAPLHVFLLKLCGK